MFRSSIPSFRRDIDWWSDWDYPSRYSDHSFGLELSEEEFFSPSFYRAYKMRPKRSSKQMFTGEAKVTNSVKKFQVIIDVNHFKPEEITVKTVDNNVIVHGKHEEKPDMQGFVTREFSRRYELPDNIDPENVVAFLSSDGILKVEAQKTKYIPPNERIIPIKICEETTITTTVEKEKETVKV